MRNESRLRRRSTLLPAACISDCIINRMVTQKS